MTKNKSIQIRILQIMLLFGAFMFMACPTDSDPEETAAGTPVATLGDLSGTWVGGSSGGGGGSGSTAGKLVVSITNASTGGGIIQKNGGTDINCTYAVPSAGKLTVTYTDSTPAETFDASINDAGALILIRGETTWTLTFRGTGSGGNPND
jgi:hypothetical protein